MFSGVFKGGIVDITNWASMLLELEKGKVVMLVTNIVSDNYINYLVYII